MLDNILGLVKGIAQEAIANNADIPSDKKDAVAETATDAIASGLTSNLAGLTSLFSGGGNNSLMDGIQNNVVGALAQKVGLNPDLAKGIASSIIPSVISTISGKLSDPNEKGFNLDSILGAFTDSDTKKGGGLLDTISGLFGK